MTNVTPPSASPPCSWISSGSSSAVSKTLPKTAPEATKVGISATTPVVIPSAPRTPSWASFRWAVRSYAYGEAAAPSLKGM